MGILRHKRQTSWFEVDQVALAGSVQEILQDFSKTIRETLDSGSTPHPGCQWPIKFIYKV